MKPRFQTLLVSIVSAMLLTLTLSVRDSAQSATDVTVRLIAPAKVSLAQVTGKPLFTVEVTTHSTPIAFSTYPPWGVRVALYDTKMRPLYDPNDDGFGADKMPSLSLNDLKTIPANSTVKFPGYLYGLRRPLTPGTYFVRALLISTPEGQWGSVDLAQIHKKHIPLWNGKIVGAAQEIVISQ